MKLRTEMLLSLALMITTVWKLRRNSKSRYSKLSTNKFI